MKEEKKYMIFYYDVDEDGIPVCPAEELESIFKMLNNYFNKQNIEVLLIPRYISHSGLKTKEEMIEILSKYLADIVEEQI